MVVVNGKESILHKLSHHFSLLSIDVICRQWAKAATADLPNARRNEQGASRKARVSVRRVARWLETDTLSTREHSQPFDPQEILAPLGAGRSVSRATRDSIETSRWRFCQTLITWKNFGSNP